MVDTDSTDTPLEAAAGPRATEAFSVLGNETRLSILLALWEAFEPGTEETAVTFSTLRERVGLRDSGQFNYHLDKLVGHFVEQSDDGYELTQAGLTFVQAVVAGTAIHDPRLGPDEVAESCPRCGAPTTVAYENEGVTVACTECPGFFQADTYRDGTIIRFTFPPAGLDGRTPREILHAAFSYQLHRVETMMDGVCPTCGGRVDTWLDVCEAHDASDGVCDACGTPFIALVRWSCRTCKASFGGPSWAPVLNHPAVVAFFYEHGIEHDHSRWAAAHRGYACEEELVSTDPLRLRITVPAGDDELHVTVDEGLNVVDVSQRA